MKNQGFEKFGGGGGGAWREANKVHYGKCASGVSALFAPSRWLQTKYLPPFNRNVAVFEISSSGEVGWNFNVYCHVILPVLSFTNHDCRPSVIAA